MSQEPQTRRNLYGRRRGPTLKPARRSLMRERMPARAALAPGQTAPLDPNALFPQARALWLEIGFGGGEHLAAMAAAHPEAGLIGCEHYLNGVASALAQLEEQGLDNVKLHHGDARDLMDLLPDGAVARAFLLYPDPWPKLRHHKRRFINPDNLDAFARILAPGARLHVASDIPDYIRWTLAHLRARPEFRWTAAGAADWRAPWEGWPGTRYERKALREGRAPAYLTFERVAP